MGKQRGPKLRLSQARLERMMDRLPKEPAKPTRTKKKAKRERRARGRNA